MDILGKEKENELVIVIVKFVLKKKGKQINNL